MVGIEGRFSISITFIDVNSPPTLNRFSSPGRESALTRQPHAQGDTTSGFPIPPTGQLW